MILTHSFALLLFAFYISEDFEARSNLEDRKERRH